MAEFDQTLFQELLSRLTSSARDLINEITSIAEQNISHSETIVDLIEQRIRKCVPQYKLFGFYVLDSIVKNIGNPYTLLFSNNLYQLFTETYLLVTDVQTRQFLIDLFTTWKKGYSSTGLEIFSKDLLTRIEKFIIKATSLNPPPEKEVTQVPIPNNITPEHFHREFNYLLQYIIQMNNELQKFDGTKFSKVHLRIRNEFVSRINEIDEMIIRDSKTEFLMKTGFYHHNVVDIRAKLDQENIKQNRFILKNFKPDLKPDPKYISLLLTPFEPVEENDNLYFYLEDFGIKLKQTEGYYLPSEKETTPPNKDKDNKLNEEYNGTEPEEEKADSNPLGLGFSLDFGFGDEGLESKDVQLQALPDNSQIEQVQQDDLQSSNLPSQVQVEQTQIEGEPQIQSTTGSNTTPKRSLSSSTKPAKKVRFNV